MSRAHTIVADAATERKIIESLELENHRKDDLEMAMCTRVVSDDEMAEVLALGYRIFLRYHYFGNLQSSCRPYLESDLQDRYYKLLEAQGRLRIYAKHLAENRTEKGAPQ